MAYFVNQSFEPETKVLQRVGQDWSDLACIFTYMLLLSRFSCVQLCATPETAAHQAPWDSPGKNTGVCCHFLLQCMKVESESELTQSGPILSNPMDCSLPGSSTHGICQARVLEWDAIEKSILLISHIRRWLAWISRYGKDWAKMPWLQRQVIYYTTHGMRLMSQPWHGTNKL